MFEARHNYLVKVNELAMQHLARADLKGLIIAGLADLKTELLPMLSQPLASKVMKLVDVAYSGIRGFHQAIDEASDVLRDVPLVREKALIGRLMDEISKDTNKYSFGVKATLKALDLGVVESIIVWEKHPLTRYRIADSNGERVVVQRDLRDRTVKILEQQPLVDWIIENCGKFGAQLHVVSDVTPEGHQFCLGFGGLAAFLRYPLEVPDEEEEEEEEEEDVSEEDIGGGTHSTAESSGSGAAPANAVSEYAVEEDDIDIF